MIDYAIVFEGFTCLWIVACLVFTLRLIGRGRRDSLLFVNLIFLASYGLPLILDLTFGIPQYSLEGIFYYAARDETTRIIYCAFLWATPLIWLLLLSRTPVRIEDHKLRIGYLEFTVLATVLILPLIFVLRAPDPWVYSHYAQLVGLDTREEIVVYHGQVAVACMGAIIAAGGIVATASDWRLGLAATMPFLVMANFFGGKRFSVAFSVVLVLYVLWQTKIVVGRKLKVAVAAGVVVIGAFSYTYQQAVRHAGAESRTTGDFYDDLRVDFGRDSRMQTAIYAELNPAYQILDYRGESFVFCLVAPIPRSWWADKPWVYSVYFTSAMLGKRSAEDLGWQMTTGLLDEAVANCGWLGLLVGPLLIGLLCRFGDSFREPFIRVLTGILGALLLLLQIPALFAVIGLWLFFVCRYKLVELQRRRNARANQLKIGRALAPGV